MIGCYMDVMGHHDKIPSHMLLMEGCLSNSCCLLHATWYKATSNDVGDKKSASQNAEVGVGMKKRRHFLPCHNFLLFLSTFLKNVCIFAHGVKPLWAA
jgi:hypothetical protein